MYYKQGRVKDIKEGISTFDSTSKMTIPVGCYKLWVYNIIPGATTKKFVQEDTPRNYT